jgi:hypothetical protein
LQQVPPANEVRKVLPDLQDLLVQVAALSAHKEQLVQQEQLAQQVPWVQLVLQVVQQDHKDCQEFKEFQD